MSAGKSRRAFDKLKGHATSLGAESRFKGELAASDSCVVYGAFEGSCRLDGDLVVTGSGRWTGDIVAHNVLVAGEVEGAITANGKIELLSGAHIEGRLASPVIAIAQGAVHVGEVHMADETELIHFTEKRKGPA